MNRMPRPNLPNDGNGSNQVQMPWPGPHAGLTPPRFASPHVSHGYSSPFSNQSVSTASSGPHMSHMSRGYSPFGNQNVSGDVGAHNMSHGYSPFRNQSGSSVSPGFHPRVASPHQDQTPSYRNNYCVRCVPGGPLCPCYARANNNLFTRETGTQVDMSDVASSKYKKDDYFQEGTDACKLLSDQIRRVRDKQNLTINSSQLTIENAADKVAEKITDLAEKTPRTVKLIKRKLKRSIINHDNYSKTKTMTKSSKRKLSVIDEQAVPQPTNKKPRVEMETSPANPQVEPGDATLDRSPIGPKTQTKGNETCTTENGQQVTFEPNMFVITAEDENKFEYLRVDKIIPDEDFGHYFEATYLTLGENRELAVLNYPKTTKPWIDLKVPRDAVIMSLGFNSHVSLEVEKQILQLIQEIYAV